MKQPFGQGSELQFKCEKTFSLNMLFTIVPYNSILLSVFFCNPILVKNPYFHFLLRQLLLTKKKKREE